MKKVAILISTVALLVGLSGVLVAGGHGEGAVVTKDGLCALTTGVPAGIGTLYTNDSQSVVTPSGNTKLTCHFTFDPAHPDAPLKAIKSNGFGCSTPGGVTSNSQSIVTPGGTATLVCQIKADN